MAAQRHDTPQAGTRRFGDRLRQARVRAHLSQAALAERIRVSRVIIASYETGKAAPELSRAVRLAEILAEDPQEFLLLAAIQREWDAAQENTSFASTIEDLLRKAGRKAPRTLASAGPLTHASLLDFPGGFTPLTIIVGDKREDEPKNAGDLFAFSSSTVDDRWLLRLGLERETEKISDKVLMTADDEWLRKRFGSTHILAIGSPASNLFTRELNECFLFRFAISVETKHKWNETRRILKGLRTPAALSRFKEESRADLRQTMRLFKQPGFLAFNFRNLKLGIDPAENRDFAVVSLGCNPFAAKDAPYFAILAAGVHHPGTAHAVKMLGEPLLFERHPFGGIIEVQVPSDEFNRDMVQWHEKIKDSKAVWHRAGAESLEYTPEEFLRRLGEWLPRVEKGEIVTDVALSADELKGHIALIELLAAAKFGEAVPTSAAGAG